MLVVMSARGKGSAPGRSRIELGNDDIVAAHRRERPQAEVDRLRGHAGEEDRSGGGIGGDPDRVLLAVIAEELAPGRRASGRRELGNDEVGLAASTISK